MNGPNEERGGRPGRPAHTFAVCAYQDSPYLEACLRSLRAQTRKADIILCTSTPSGYLRDLAARFQIPLYIREGKPDIQDDWNFAYHQARGEYVTIAHQDDLYHRRYVETLMGYGNAYPDMTLFMTDYVTIRHGRLEKKGSVEWVKKLLRLPLRLKPLADRRWVKRSALVLGNPVCCPSCAYHKDALGEPLFHSDFHFALDWDLYLALSDWPGRFVCVEKPLVYYRVHEGATTNACIQDHSRMREEMEMFYQLWPGPVVDLIMRFYQKAYDSYR